jgi:hypothetical protein
MKKYILLLNLIFLMFIAFSQETVLTSKKGIPILPQKGDWAIGIDARPFTNIFNSNSDMRFDFISDNTLIGKKFIQDNLAHRGKLRIAFHSNEFEEFVMQDGQIIPDPTITVTDKQTINDMVISLGYGMEKRSGYGRLQAVYGAEVFLNIGSYNESYDYGNSFSMTNPNPNTYDFGYNIPESGKRVIYAEDGTTLGATLRPFLGVEFFVGPKISVGGEFGYGITYSNTGEGKTKVASWDATGNNVKYDINKTGGSTGFNIDTDNFDGAIFIMFYFK